MSAHSLTLDDVTPRAAPMSPDERRRAIIDAVLPLLIEHGDAVTTRLIAEAAGIAEGTIFRVFADKDALIHAVAAETLNPADADEVLRAALAGLRGPARQGPDHRRPDAAPLRAGDRGDDRAAQGWLRPTSGASTSAGRPPGPPEFVVDAHPALLERLIEVFEPYRDELTVDPRAGRAAAADPGARVPPPRGPARGPARRRRDRRRPAHGIHRPHERGELSCSSGCSGRSWRRTAGRSP